MGFRDLMALGCSVPIEARALLKGQRVSKSLRTRSSKCLSYSEHSNKHSNRNWKQCPFRYWDSWSRNSWRPGILFLPWLRL